MFVRCKLLLSQNNGSLEVVLNPPTAAVLRDVASYWGSFSSLEGGRSAGGIPKERKVWLYAQGKWELTLMDSGGPDVGMGGGGLGYGELASLPPAATLSHAVMTPRGVEPSDSSGIGVGQVMKAAEISVAFHPGRMTWKLLGFQERNYSTWKSP